MSTSTLDRNTVFTTGQVAKICKVASRTVSQWFDSGKLKGYRLPGSDDRRIPIARLQDFLRENGMPPLDMPCVVLLSNDASLENLLRTALGDVPFHRAGTAVETGILLGANPVGVLVVDCGNAPDACKLSHDLVNGSRPAIMIAIDDHERQANVTERFSRPFDPALFAQRVRTLAPA